MDDEYISVKQRLINALASYELPVILQGSLSQEEEYPPELFTFYINASDDDRHYDNAETRTVYSIDLNFYSTDPARTNSVLRQAKPQLKAAGFIPTGSGYDLQVDDPEIHTGQGMTIYYIERIENT